MSRPQRAPFLALTVAVAALVLAGCSTPTPHGGTTPPTASPTPSPTPTPTQAAIPQSGLTLGCADVESAPFVAAHYLGDKIGISVDENSTAHGFSYRAFQQGGGLRCVWGGSGRTDGGYDLGMELLILTNAASDFATFASSDHPNITWVADRLGDHSIEFCFTVQTSLQCYGDVLIGSSWLDFRLTDESHALTLGQTYAWADEQIAPAIAAITRADPPRASWKPPASAFDTSKLCDPATASAIAGGPVKVEVNQSTSAQYPDEVGRGRAATAQCNWTSSVANANISIAALTGGAWALSGMTANLGEAPGYIGGAARPVTIANADGAFVAGGQAAWGAIISGGSLVEVTMDSSDGSVNEPMMTKLAAYISAHP